MGDGKDKDEFVFPGENDRVPCMHDVETREHYDPRGSMDDECGCGGRKKMLHRISDAFLPPDMEKAYDGSRVLELDWRSPPLLARPTFSLTFRDKSCQ